MKSLRAVLLLSVLVNALPAQADWQLQQALLNFVSIKNNAVGENHRFDRITGSIDGHGKADIRIDLESVNTGIDIRDKRLREFLFATGDFPYARLSTSVDIAAIDQLKPGQAATQTVDLTIELHGQQQVLPVQAGMVKTLDGALHVESLSPVLLDATRFDLLAGIVKLQELAGLQAIATVIPITFAFVFAVES